MLYGTCDEDEFRDPDTGPFDVVDDVRTLVDALPHWQSVTVRSRGDPAAFELRLTDPPVLSAVASAGGSVESTVIEDGDCRMTIHLGTSADVRRLTEAVVDAYPQAELLRREQISRIADGEERDRPRWSRDLSDRQRAALEAAYHAGFFEWPRDASGEEVAVSLGIAPSTFHQHLRLAQRKVFDGLLSSSPISTG